MGSTTMDAFLTAKLDYVVKVSNVHLSSSISFSLLVNQTKTTTTKQEQHLTIPSSSSPNNYNNPISFECYVRDNDMKPKSVFLVVAHKLVGRGILLERMKDNFKRVYGARIGAKGLHPVAAADDDDLFGDTFSLAYNLDEEFGKKESGRGSIAMAESVVSFLPEKLVAMEKQEVDMLKLEQMKLEFRTIKALLRDADAKVDIDQGVKDRVEQVRDIAYEIEDVLDEFFLRHHKDHDDAAGHGRHGTAPTRCIKGILQRIANIFHCLKSGHEIGSPIKDIKARIHEISSRRDRYNFRNLVKQVSTSSKVKSTTKHDPRENALFQEEFQLVGIDGAKEMLVCYLLEADTRLGVVDFQFLVRAVLPRPPSSRWCMTALSSSKLLRLWVAEGFVERKIVGMEFTMEEIARFYLDEFIQRNLVQVEYMLERKRAKKCRIHDLMREFIIAKARDQNLATIIAEKQEELRFLSSDHTTGQLLPRPMSISCLHQDTGTNILSDNNTSGFYLRIRSLYLFMPYKGSWLARPASTAIFSSFRLLRVQTHKMLVWRSSQVKF
ncbi:hypothetical protein FRX31_032681 [Thalictrum thalictroides]|uniref:Rx N-terminal domain-containing protein n=1 Tax=Thalictrum thalictroides TaxID=46969 RepID=A0A7J6UZZ2_THATH|nr:hypothetical protein FRX31_032681 [Thalictrum thalictroides]